jgi:transposase
MALYTDVISYIQDIKIKRFVQGQGRTQGTLLPECLDDYVAEDNAVRVIDVFVDEFDLANWVFRVSIPWPRATVASISRFIGPRD